MKNYRPISLLCTLSKVFESSFSTFQLSSSFQSYLHFSLILFNADPPRSNFWSLHQTFSIIPVVNRPLISSTWTLRKLFTVSLMVTTCLNCGVCILEWLKDHLTNRVQMTSIEAYSFFPTSCYFWFPLGKYPQSFLLILFVNDLPNSTSNFPPLLFADNCKTFTQIKSPSNSILLQCDLDALYTWNLSQKLPFHLSKCVAIHLYPCPATVQLPSYSIGDVPVEFINHHHDLHVAFSESFHWSNHLASIISMAYKTLFFPK